jgi:uncharacterized protein
VTALRIGVVSDTHGNCSLLEHVIDSRPDITGWVHCGDGVHDLEVLCEVARSRCQRVAGNMDPPGSGMDLCTFERGDVRFLVVHGHRQQVHFDLQRLVDEAHRHDARVVLYGHTHQALHRLDEGIHLFNPGSLARHEARRTFGVVEMDGRRQLTFEHIEV